jgi:hypothetical protein
MQGSHETIRAHDNRSFWELESILLDSLEIFPSGIGLSDRPRSEVHHFVPISRDIGVKLCDSEMSPIPTDHRKDMAESVRSRVGTTSQFNFVVDEKGTS